MAVPKYFRVTKTSIGELCSVFFAVLPMTAFYKSWPVMEFGKHQIIPAAFNPIQDGRYSDSAIVPVAQGSVRMRHF